MPRAGLAQTPALGLGCGLVVTLRCQWCMQLFRHRLGERLYVPKCCSKAHASRLAQWGRQHPRVVQ